MSTNLETSLSTTFSPNSPQNTNANTTLAISALARFEFEAGKANDGTKVLMVEWQDDELTRSGSPTGGSWHVAWEGKQAVLVLPAGEEQTQMQTSQSTRRVFYLLPPNVTIPPVVRLLYEPPNESKSKSSSSSETHTNTDTDSTGSGWSKTLQLNPLPAIFPPELGATGRSAGKKGVLHTIWAKKRLQVLEREIYEECLTNAEGVALQMALQEKEWIESNFGVSAKGGNNDIYDAPSLISESGSASTRTVPSSYPMGPGLATPAVSPTSGTKFGEKLKGLKLQTGGGSDYLPPRGEPTPDTLSNAHLLSPQSPDVAVSSFTSFSSVDLDYRAVPKPVSSRHPPDAIPAQQASSAIAGFSSLSHGSKIVVDAGEDLFAIALSPRSPDLPRSPFSFPPHETMTMARVAAVGGDAA